MDHLSWNVLISAGIVIVGWIVGHRLNLHRDTSAKRRELRVQYLLEAYRRLEGASNRDLGMAIEGRRAFESAVADIQLLGTSEQVAALLAYLREHAESGGSDITSVLELLRADLRRELNLGTNVERVRVFRFREHEQPSLSAEISHVKHHDAAV